MSSLKISENVGSGNSKNSEKDVKLIQSLLNVNQRKENKDEIKISGKMNQESQELINSFQQNKLNMSKPDGVIEPNKNTFKKLKEELNKIFSKKAITDPDYGLVTWQSEGNEGGIYHSRKLHVPSDNSGLTLGRGYDLKTKKMTTVSTELTDVGLKEDKVKLLKKAVGLYGNSARQFIIDNDLLDYQVSPEQQKKLFKKSYDFESSEVQRICKKRDTVAEYGKVDWDKLNQNIKDIVIDLKFRGDYTSSSRELIQKSIADNDFKAFKKVLIDRKNWSAVPNDRFNRRKKFLEDVK